MNSDPHNPIANAAHSNTGEETLRLIASLPAPEGLEEHLHKALRAAPQNGRVLAWPMAMRSRLLRSSSVRTAAAAAIVFVVLGGGWGVYSRVAQIQSGKVVTMPVRMPAPGGFAGAGAIRTPETLPGPTVKLPANNSKTQKRKNKSQPAAPAAIAH